MLNILKAARNIFIKFIERINLLKYNEFTIENYFRRKGYRVGVGNRIFIRDLGGEPYLVEIGNHCTITIGVMFITHDGGCWVFRKEKPELNIFGKIEIKDNCYIGVNTLILPNITIGPNSVVGAGSVVTKNVPADTVVAGVPAKVICSLQEYRQKSFDKWERLNLKGARSDWKKQLIEHFWGNLKKD
ncbi:MAG: acyltransferase [Nanoarchaeota archaeon]